MENIDNKFLQRMGQGIIVFDGAVGSNLQELDLNADDFGGKDGCNEYLVRTRPDVVRELHASFLQVGVDVIETNTFGASAVVLAEYELAHEDYALNKEAAELAKAVAEDYSTADHPRFVAGSMGPGTKLPSLGHISFADLHIIYRRQTAGLIDGGVDLLIVETCQDLLQTKAALIAIFDEFKERHLRLPVIVQVTMENTGTMLLGTDMLGVITALAPFPIDVLGLNCATGPKDMGAHVRTLVNHSPFPVSVIPNAGLPRNVGGKMVYTLTPQELAADLAHFISDLGVNVVGGCCGTTPEHLKAVLEAVNGLAPATRSIEFESAVSSLYGNSVYDVEPKPLIIGERTNANGSKKFRSFLLEEDIDGMMSIAREQVQEQAHILDVCVAYVGRDEVEDISKFAFRLNTACTLPIMIDSTEPPAIEATLQRLAGKSLINSINLEDGEGRAREVLALCKRYGAAVVALTIDEDGMAKSAERKLSIARRLYQLAVEEYGLDPADIFFDALTFTLGSGEEEFRTAAIETMQAITDIKAEFPGVHTVLGVSNISFGLKPYIRHRLNSVFLHHAIQAGLDSAIIHAGKIKPLYQLPDEDRTMLEDLVFDRRKDEYDPLMVIMEHFADKKAIKPEEQDLSELPIVDRLQKRIIDGNRVGLNTDLDEALKAHDALTIVNTILLEGMKTVGELFGAGEMQLPFVLQSAETMKASVSYLEPHMERSDVSARGTLVIATVKGDVHDIGKNLVDIILTNNGFKVVNLGIKQPVETIIDSFKRNKADAIGMSGLLVKSTIIMKENLEVLQERGITPPVLLGGAALNRKYVEEDLAEIYPDGRVHYAKDAFDGLRLMSAIVSGEEIATKKRLKVRKKKAVRPRVSSKSKIQPVQPPEPPFWGSRIVTDIPLSTVIPYINRVALFRGQWGVKKKGRDDPAYDKLVSDILEPTLQKLFTAAHEEKTLQPAVAYGYFPANKDGDNLLIFDSPDDDNPAVTIQFPRQDEENGRCIADFFHPIESGIRDVIGLQLVTVGPKATMVAQHLFNEDNYTDYLYYHGLSVETAEALAEYWHQQVRQELGIGGNDGDDIPSLFRQQYRGSRFSFGYPACPRLEDQEHIFSLLKPERIGVSLTDEWQLVPEQSTSAIIVHHPDAKYFSV